jgi:mannose/fructose/sorbose-specific phosphotransferase system IIB component
VRIELVRIDDRLIHGQIVMAWSKAVSVERIVVIDNQVANDLIHKILLETVSPPGVKLSIFDVVQGIEYLKKDSFSEEKVLLLVTKPATILALVESGLRFSKINIGGMSFGPGRKQLTKAVAIDDADKHAFKELHKWGIMLQIQVLPNDIPVDLMTQIE